MFYGEFNWSIFEKCEEQLQLKKIINNCEISQQNAKRTISRLLSIIDTFSGNYLDEWNASFLSKMQIKNFCWITFVRLILIRFWEYFVKITFLVTVGITVPLGSWNFPERFFWLDFRENVDSERNSQI